VLILASVVLMVVLKWNPIQWLGWVAAVFACIYMLHTLVWGLNYYAGDLSDDLRMDVSQYNLDELTEAAEYYRDKANALAEKVSREGGDVAFDDFETLAAMAGNGFDTLVYDHSYPVFAGSDLPVKKLGWADMYTSMGITGFTMPLTGEAAVNPNIPAVSIPFTMCHEMAHRMCIAYESDANLAAFLACLENSDVNFRYSANFMAFLYCYNALAGVGTSTANVAMAEIRGGINDQLRNDWNDYVDFFAAEQKEGATNVANKVNDAYIKGSGDDRGVTAYSEVCDLLVSWHIQEIYLPAHQEEVPKFDPLDKDQVDISGLPNAGGN
jgi:hypothetical protein